MKPSELMRKAANRENFEGCVVDTDGFWGIGMCDMVMDVLEAEKLTEVADSVLFDRTQDILTGLYKDDAFAVTDRAGHWYGRIDEDEGRENHFGRLTALCLAADIAESEGE